MKCKCGRNLISRNEEAAMVCASCDPYVQFNERIVDPIRLLTLSMKTTPKKKAWQSPFYSGK